jgi:hypothetical protein
MTKPQYQIHRSSLAQIVGKIHIIPETILPLEDVDSDVDEPQPIIPLKNKLTADRKDAAPALKRKRLITESIDDTDENATISTLNRSDEAPASQAIAVRVLFTSWQPSDDTIRVRFI